MKKKCNNNTYTTQVGYRAIFSVLICRNKASHVWFFALNRAIALHVRNRNAALETNFSFFVIEEMQVRCMGDKNMCMRQSL